MSAKKLVFAASFALVLSIAGSYIVVTTLTEAEPTVVRHERPRATDDELAHDTGAPEAVEVEAATATPQLTVPVTTAAVVVGSVRFNDDGTPVADVEVRFTLQQDGAAWVERTRTSAAGAFRYESDEPFTIERRVVGNRRPAIGAHEGRTRLCALAFGVVKGRAKAKAFGQACGKGLRYGRAGLRRRGYEDIIEINPEIMPPQLGFYLGQITGRDEAESKNLVAAQILKNRIPTQQFWGVGAKTASGITSPGRLRKPVARSFDSSLKRHLLLCSVEARHQPLRVCLIQP